MYYLRETKSACSCLRPHAWLMLAYMAKTTCNACAKCALCTLYSARVITSVIKYCMCVPGHKSFVLVLECKAHQIQV